MDYLEDKTLKENWKCDYAVLLRKKTWRKGS